MREFKVIPWDEVNDVIQFDERDYFVSVKDGNNALYDFAENANVRQFYVDDENDVFYVKLYDDDGDAAVYEIEAFRYAK